MNTASMRHIIRRPLLSEKAHRKQEAGVMCFEVSRDANKIEIRRAVESLFGVKVLKVRTMTRRGKTRRFRMTPSKRPDWKKAYVVLQPGEKVVQFENFVVEDKA
jgi:large subunit ribosomal protein L23